MKEVLHHARNLFFSISIFPASVKASTLSSNTGRLLLCGCISKRVRRGQFLELWICQHVTSRRVLESEGQAVKHSSVFGRVRGKCPYLWPEVALSLRDLLPISHAARNRGRWAEADPGCGPPPRHVGGLPLAEGTKRNGLHNLMGGRCWGRERAATAVMKLYGF